MPVRQKRPVAPVLATLALATLAAIGGAPPATAEHESGVTLYVDANFRGKSETFVSDVPRLDDTRLGNDRVSSVRLAPGCTATLFTDAYYRGRSTQVTHDVYDLHGTPIGNDRASSLQVRCERRRGDAVDWSSRRGIALYSDAEFDGRREIFYGDDSDLRNNRIGNDAASSVSLAPGCRLTLFADAGYRGRSVDLTSDVENLGRTRLGNDAASSLRLSCGGRDRPRGRHRDDRPDDRPRRENPGHDDPDYGQDDRGRDGYGQDGYGQDGYGGVTLFRDEDFRGRGETFFDDVRDLGTTPLGRDTASSVRVAPGCRANLYRDVDFRGQRTEITRDVSSLKFTPVGNDAVSSIEVDCDRR